LVGSIAKILDIFRKLAPVPLLALGIASAIILFAPLEFVENLGVDSFRKEYRAVIGVVFLMSWSYLLAHLIWWIRGKIVARFKLRQIRSYLYDLTPEEKHLLAPYILNDKTSQYFDYGDGVVMGLINKRIIYQASSLTGPFKFPGNICTWARRYLKQHQELLK